ncbi:N-acetylmuramoyl-L-alanine amidase [Lapillicoccus jejuensis]|uniref:N-acetylmuramoyl-L-alanine amidase n=1 Tax=Lapillicoccus jejuensis TaxID=402171 RepID=A0A542DZ41_9MICO|nr:N-acetylmuramoyl-L-alanine amidase [Lapillicoccus jejuensis]TQJ08361.1 N-acetylmuramoyl-L-alanine amidase [Lapillicoccus jejuensis]
MTDQPDTVAGETVLRRGAAGDAVRRLRARLHATGDLTPTGPAPDDGFDEPTDRAVRAFQQRRGLIVDGVVGRSTAGALEASAWALGDRLLRHLPGHLLRGDDVDTLQQRLVGLGFDPGRVDGVYGPQTEDAVRAFQRGYGLVPDGLVGPQTLRSLDNLRRSVSGGAPHVLREAERVRRSGHQLAGRVVVVDAGHGGEDGGGRGSTPDGAHLDEADVVLDLARRIEGRLGAHGATVLHSRSGGTADGGSEEERAQFANDCGADLVLSLHCDHAGSGVANGVATFYYGHDGVGAWSAVGHQLAELMQREVVARSGLTDCRSHARTWTLLQATTMPTVRLEVGYLSNPADAAALASPAVRDDIAEGVVVALQRLYLGEDDVAETGLLRLGELRRMLDAARAAG